MALWHDVIATIFRCKAYLLLYLETYGMHMEYAFAFVLSVPANAQVTAIQT